MAAGVALLAIVAVLAGGAYVYLFSGVRSEICTRPSETIEHFRAEDGTPLKGVFLGQGSAGVVLAHQSDQTQCAWLPFARQLAATGFRTLTLDLPPNLLGNSTWDHHVGAAITYLRRNGAVSVVLIGASLGGAASMVASAETLPRSTRS